MRIEWVVLGFSLLVGYTHATGQAGETVEISGETVVGTEPPTEEEGDKADGAATGFVRANALKEAQESKPFFCEVAGKCAGATASPANWGNWVAPPGPDTIDADCQMACQNPCLGMSVSQCKDIKPTCDYAYVEGGVCYQATGDAASCVSDGDASVTTYLPGNYNDDGEQECPQGIPAPGIPQEKMSIKECVVVDKQCICPDVTTKFEASERTCKASMEVAPWAHSAFYDENRVCHLRRCKCDQPGDITEHTIDPAVGPQPTVTTFVRMPTDPEECPEGMKPYEPPVDPFTDQFCTYENMICTADEDTDVYHLDTLANRGRKISSAEECRNKCSNLQETCGGAFSHLVNGVLRCVMQRELGCAEDKIKPAPEGDGATLNIRVPANVDQASYCKKTVKGKPLSVEWSAKFCGFPNADCQKTIDATIASISDVVPCLTVVNDNDYGGAVLNADGCHLLQADATCAETDSEFITNVPGSQYFRVKQEGDECVFPENVCAGEVQHLVQYKTTPVITPAISGVCGDGGETDGANDNTGGTDRCGAAELTGAKYHPVAGCTCSGDNVWSDAHNACVNPAQCTCQLGDKHVPTDSQILYLNENCKQKNVCEVPSTDGVSSIFTYATDEDSFCKARFDKGCVNIDGIGHCVCALGFELGADGFCASTMV